ncbi:raffinose/stachyose/melibiose transport system substrate-binding protein [Paenibacillus endophyticus]|uniref:Raffinose/stachyose/melibiose transport system substrate-binding protein n=1 Tax=Paenibacillus endophyticus TaxID=1294268 RepID=A0A7W5C3S7_9BACL|nr:sugar ABC transporter substrate-binding protein [Paenibacillus endophyticus]MBB3150693.1 raffinose/stachyose/melibiose transport system substrate-binding protein [Paenibacillus endophyticus]
MKKGSFKFALVLALSVCLLLTAAACGNKNAESNTGNNGGAASGEQETVTFWSWVPTDVQAEKAIAAFEAANPNIKVDYWRGEQTDFQKKLQVAMAANEGPDLLGMQVGGMLNQYANTLEPIEALADKNWGAGWQDNFVKASIDQVKATDGTMVALPLNLTGQEFVLYNKTIFDKLGITKVPATYEEWLSVNATIREKGDGIVPVAFGAKDIWHDVDMFVSLSNQFAPGKIYEAEQGKLAWTDQAFVDTMTAWSKLFTDKVMQDGALGLSTYPDARDQYFYSGKAAMFLTGSWHAGFSLPGGEKDGTAIENDETGIFLLPQIGPNEARAVASVDTALSINKSSKHKEAAWKLLEFMTQGEGQQIMADFIQGSPAKVGVQIQSLDQFKFEAEREGIKTVNDAIANAIGKRLLDYPELTNAIGVAMQDVAAGKSIETALKDIQKVSDGIDRN